MAGDVRITYFAYGSYLFPEKLKFDGVESAEKVSHAVLRGYRLRMNKQSVDGSFKANIESTGSHYDMVRGVLWNIDRREVPILKKAEGCPTGYRKEKVVVLDERGHQWSTVACAGCEDTVRPYDGEVYDWYLAMIVKGAQENGFPEHYVNLIRSFKSKADDDRERAERMFAAWLIIKGFNAPSIGPSDGSEEGRIAKTIAKKG